MLLFKTENEKMKILTEKRCIIGEGPIWNEKEQALYFTNGGDKELCKYYPKNEKMSVIPLKKDCAAFVFDKLGNIIASNKDGVFLLEKDGSEKEIYDTKKFEIKYANDMKVGPDGKIYVGTQSEKRMGISEKTNGKLFSIDAYGNVKTLLENLQLSNGMEWSMDENFFYHTDSDTNIIKEYKFDKEKGKIAFTNRQIEVLGVDGFTIGTDNKLYCACWGQGHIATVDIKSMTIDNYIKTPAKIPASCCFCGKNADILSITTASFSSDIKEDKNAGYTILMKTKTKGRKPYLFG